MPPSEQKLDSSPFPFTESCSYSYSVRRTVFVLEDPTTTDITFDQEKQLPGHRTKQLGP